MKTQHFQDKPCEVLTDTQLDQIGIPLDGEYRDGSVGHECRWSNLDTGAAVAIRWGSPDGRGLTAVYEKKDQYEFFQELAAIDGYPIVASGFTDRRDTGNCGVVVGLTDRLSFMASTGQSREKVGKVPPCQAAHRIAGMMLETIQGG